MYLQPNLWNIKSIVIFGSLLIIFSACQQQNKSKASSNKAATMMKLFDSVAMWKSDTAKMQYLYRKADLLETQHKNGTTIALDSNELAIVKSLNKNTILKNHYPDIKVPKKSNLEIKDTTWLIQLRKHVNGLPDELDKIDYLRHFVYETANINTDATTYLDSIYKDVPLNIYEYYKIFDEDLAGINCGGAADFLSKLYKHFGIENQKFDMGGNSNDSHVVNLVYHNNKWLIRDAFWYLNIINQNTQQEMDYCSLMNFLHTEQYDSIGFEQPKNLPATDILFGSLTALEKIINEKKYILLMYDKYGSYDTIITNPKTGFAKMIYQRSFDLSVEANNNAIGRFLVSNNQPDFYPCLFLFPKNEVVGLPECH